MLSRMINTKTKKTIFVFFMFFAIYGLIKRVLIDIEILQLDSEIIYLERHNREIEAREKVEQEKNDSSIA